MLFRSLACEGNGITNLSQKGGDLTMKETLLTLGALAALAYLLIQAFLTALQPLFAAFSGHLR